jgi:hypothetical protein
MDSIGGEEMPQQWPAEIVLAAALIIGLEIRSDITECGYNLGI